MKFVVSVIGVERFAPHTGIPVSSVIPSSSRIQSLLRPFIYLSICGQYTIKRIPMHTT